MMGDSNRVVRTLVLVGRTGNGKSATGNTILGRNAFESKRAASGVTKGCELQTVRKDGQIINVIDTPGLFDSSVTIEHVAKEILKCIDLAKDGIHAVLVVFSVKTRFSEEEATILHSLRTLFGSKIVNYMIVVFTGGDELEDDETLQGYLGRDCPQPLKDILILCKNRMVLFDNRPRNESKRKVQVQELISLVNRVVNQNDRKSYTNEFFANMKKREEIVGSLKGYTKQDISKLEEQMQRNYENLLKQITEMIEYKLKETIARLQRKLAKENAARKRLEEYAKGAERKLNNEISQLTNDLENARKELKKFRDKEDKTCIRIPRIF